MKLTGAQALIKSLEMEGVEVMFGLPGGAILPVYDPLIESSIRHILVRHEQGAGHMAEGYAHVTGRPGVAMVTSIVFSLRLWVILPSWVQASGSVPCTIALTWGGKDSRITTSTESTWSGAPSTAGAVGA